eukprot:1153535-Pelagomonas_calceolata.AAC.2
MFVDLQASIGYQAGHGHWRWGGPSPYTRFPCAQCTTGLVCASCPSILFYGVPGHPLLEESGLGLGFKSDHSTRWQPPGFHHPLNCPPPILNTHGYPLRAEESDCVHYTKKMISIVPVFLGIHIGKWRKWNHRGDNLQLLKSALWSQTMVLNIIAIGGEGQVSTCVRAQKGDDRQPGRLAH